MPQPAGRRPATTQPPRRIPRAAPHLPRSRAGRAALPLSRVETGRDKAAQARHSREERSRIDSLQAVSRRHGLGTRLRPTDTAKPLELTSEVTLLLQHTAALS